MIVRRLNKCGDIASSGTQFINDADAVRQTIETRLKLFLGEYFRDINDGTPWWQRILGKNQNMAIAEHEIRTRITQAPEVVRLLEFQATYEERTMRVYASVLTTYGEIEINYGND